MNITPDKLAELLKKARESRTTLPAQETQAVQMEAPVTSVTYATDKQGNRIAYNSKQQEFIDLVLSGKSCVLLGAAGTGKTTCMQGVIAALIQAGKIPQLSVTHKYLPITPINSIAITAYTRRAVSNIKRVMSADLKPNCITVHKLLEYAPVYSEIQDPVTFEIKKTMEFLPSRDKYNPLPPLGVIVVEESSMLSVELFNKINEATEIPPQFIFLGDIQQLPPVFGAAILGFKMLELPVVELTEVYRQALESPIIRLAHRILSGVPIQENSFPQWKVENKLTLHPWKKKLHPDIALLTAAKFFIAALDSGNYNPNEDMILIPFNKSFGTIELNKHIAQRIAILENKLVYEIISGFNKLYFSVGDKVLYDKEDATIVDIQINSSYLGKRPQPHATTLDYWGFNSSHSTTKSNEEDISNINVDFLLEQAASDDTRVSQASHTITLQMADSLVNVSVSQASAVNTLLHGYALTVHKSQGSEWRKVFLVIHQSHATMIQRELLYTAVTRAKEELYVICEPDTFMKGITTQRIKGNTLAEKAEYFKGKLSELTDAQ